MEWSVQLATTGEKVGVMGETKTFIDLVKESGRKVQCIMGKKLEN